MSIAGTALRAQQEAINATAHNIANASTEGYSRQDPILSPKAGLRTPQGVFGTGVDIIVIQRIRDPYLDSAYRREAGSMVESQVRSGMMGQVETVLSELGEMGLSGALDGFFSAWSSLASDPSSSIARMAVRSEGQRLTDTMNRMAGDLDILRQDAEISLLSDVQRVNELTAEVADLNQRIVTSEVGGHTAGGLRDARDMAIDELSKLLPVQILERDNGSVGVVTSGLALVDGIHRNEIELRDISGTYGVGIIGHPGLRTENISASLPLT